MKQDVVVACYKQRGHVNERHGQRRKISRLQEHVSKRCALCKCAVFAKHVDI